MKKIILIGLSTLLVCLSTNTKAQAFEEGKSYLSASYGVALFSYTSLFSSFESYGFETKSLGPIGLQYEYGVSDILGVGVSLGYSNSSVSWNNQYAFFDESYNYSYRYDFSKITANLRLNVHLAKHDVVDPYFGFGVGYKNSSFTFETNDDGYIDSISLNGIPLSMEIKFGTRFMFAENFGAFAEIGMGHGFLHGGLVGKF